MGFNSSNFQASQYQPRTAEVLVDMLSEFFDDGEKPLFKVRGLLANELMKAEEASVRRKNASALADALLTGNSAEKMKEVQRVLGFTNDPEPELSKRIEILIHGCVEPKIDRQTAVKLSEIAPIEFFNLTNEITKLTGKGQESVKKQMPSGEMKA